MSAVDVKELGPEKSDERARRLRRLKACVAARQYDVSCNEIAHGMILEVLCDMNLRKDPEGFHSLEQR